MSMLHPALVAAADAAIAAYADAKATHGRAELEAKDGIGADGTPTMVLDRIVDAAVLAAVEGAGVNVLSEEVGWVDVGSAVTLVIDPVDGTANAAAGVPISCFSGAVAIDGDVHRIMDLAATIPMARACGAVVIDAHGRSLAIDTDLTRRYSGIVAATPALAEELAATITG